MLQPAKRWDTFAQPDSGESRLDKVARKRYPGVQGAGEGVHQSSPFCSKSQSRQRGGEPRQVSPSHPFLLSPSPPSPPPPSPRISRPTLSLGAQLWLLCPQALATQSRPTLLPPPRKLLPRRCGSRSLPTHPLNTQPSVHALTPGGNLQTHCFREMHLFVCTFPANQGEERSTLAVSFCRFSASQETYYEGSYQPFKIRGTII